MRDLRPGLSAPLAISGFVVLGLLWGAVAHLELFPPSLFPHPLDVARGLCAEMRSGRLLTDVVASLFRVGVGFVMAVGIGLPTGLLLGHSAVARAVVLPIVNFLRNLSPIAWIPFAILWLGIGDTPVIFLIFGSAVLPIVLSTTAAVASVPSVWFRVADELGIKGPALLFRVTLPAVAPQIVTALRVAAGLSWMVVVAAEMIAGRDGLGFAVWDARNGLRSDLLAGTLLVIGVIGVAIDRVLLGLTRLPSLRWGYER